MTEKEQIDFVNSLCGSIAKSLVESIKKALYRMIGIVMSYAAW